MDNATATTQNQAATQRWFDENEIRQSVERLMGQVTEAGVVAPSGGSKRYSNQRLQTMQMMTNAFYVAVGAFILAVLFVPDLLPKDWLSKTDNLNMVVKAIAIIVPLGVGFAARKRLQRAVARMKKHDSCIRELVEQNPGLCYTDAAAIATASPSIPFVETGCQTNLRSCLFGEYNGCALALLEFEYVAPISFAPSDVWKKAQARIARDPDHEQFSRIRSALAVVFFKPLQNLPDMFICGEDEPLMAYQKQWVKQLGGKPNDSEMNIGLKFVGYSSCFESAYSEVPAEFVEILSMRTNSMVQLIGRTLVVVPRSWTSSTPMSSACDAFEVQLDLDFSTALYRSLVK